MATSPYSNLKLLTGGGLFMDFRQEAPPRLGLALLKALLKALEPKPH